MNQNSFNFEEQTENLERVTARLGKAVLSFIASDVDEFQADELHTFVEREVGFSAPASADRVLRHLRQKGVIDYKVVDRRASRYKVLKRPPIVS